MFNGYPEELCSKSYVIFMNIELSPLETQDLLHENVTCFRLARTEQIVSFLLWYRGQSQLGSDPAELEQLYSAYAGSATSPLTKAEFEGGCQLLRLAV